MRQQIAAINKLQFQTMCDVKEKDIIQTLSAATDLIERQKARIAELEAIISAYNKQLHVADAETFTRLAKAKL